MSGPLSTWWKCTACGTMTNDDRALDELMCERNRPNGPLVRHDWQPMPPKPETREVRTIRRLRALAAGYRARAKYNSDEDKYFLKARIYGAIAAEFRRALCAIAEGHGDPQSVARDALAWRHSVKVGVPMEAVLAIGDLLLSAESAANDERARIVAWLRERAGSWRTGIGYECEAIATELDSRADRLERGE